MTTDITFYSNRHRSKRKISLSNKRVTHRVHLKRLRFSDPARLCTRETGAANFTADVCYPVRTPACAHVYSRKKRTRGGTMFNIVITITSRER